MQETGIAENFIGNRGLSRMTAELVILAVRQAEPAGESLPT